MNITLFETHFADTCHDLSINTHGDGYTVSITKGGCKYRDNDEFCDEKFDCAVSPVFKSYDDAFKFYSFLTYELGQGNYDWEERSRFVKEGKVC